MRGPEKYMCIILISVVLILGCHQVFVFMRSPLDHGSGVIEEDGKETPLQIPGGVDWTNEDDEKFRLVMESLEQSQEEEIKRIGLEEDMKVPNMSEEDKVFLRHIMTQCANLYLTQNLNSSGFGFCEVLFNGIDDLNNRMYKLAAPHVEVLKEYVKNPSEDYFKRTRDEDRKRKKEEERGYLKEIMMDCVELYVNPLPRHESHYYFCKEIFKVMDGYNQKLYKPPGLRDKVNWSWKVAYILNCYTKFKVEAKSGPFEWIQHMYSHRD